MKVNQLNYELYEPPIYPVTQAECLGNPETEASNQTLKSLSQTTKSLEKQDELSENQDQGSKY